jgi:8-oxo-dGTP diphosphatase
MNEQIVKVGVACFVLKDGKFLMGQRKGSHGADTWSIPGGHMEFGETFVDTAKRETLEETGLEVKNISFLALTNDYFKEEGKHYITIWMVGDYDGGREEIMEPDKFIDQKWLSVSSLPEPLFLPWENLLKSDYIDNLKELAP